MITSFAEVQGCLLPPVGYLPLTQADEFEVLVKPSRSLLSSINRSAMFAPSTL